MRDHLFAQVCGHPVLHISPEHTVVKEWRKQITPLIQAWGFVQHTRMTPCYRYYISKLCQFYVLNTS